MVLLQNNKSKLFYRNAIRLAIIAAFTFIATFVNATTLNVGILVKQHISSMIFSPATGTYAVWADGKIIANADKTNIFQLTVSNDSVFVRSFEKDYGKFKEVRFTGVDPVSSFKLKTVVPSGSIRMYDDDIDIYPTGKFLRVINNVNIEHYVEGVVAAEAGDHKTLEYYKVQAVICRTYALSNIGRHADEGFELCDQVHCQVYKGITNDSLIKEAVQETHGIVIVDPNLNLITAAFHSNCGGETVNSEDVWSVSKPYLRSVKDTFCLHMPHARWQRVISRDDWTSYMSIERKKLEREPGYMKKTAHIVQPATGRKVYYKYKNCMIPLKIIRADWGLKSTYFTIQAEGNDSLLLNGRGYGHGVGLCQEGAMHMAQLGYSYQYILHHYYTNVYLVNLSTLAFFKGQ